jgi:hypothetical protein
MKDSPAILSSPKTIRRVFEQAEIIHVNLHGVRPGSRPGAEFNLREYLKFLMHFKVSIANESPR